MAAVFLWFFILPRLQGCLQHAAYLWDLLSGMRSWHVACGWMVRQAGAEAVCVAILVNKLPLT